MMPRILFVDVGGALSMFCEDGTVTTSMAKVVNDMIYHDLNSKGKIAFVGDLFRTKERLVAGPGEKGRFGNIQLRLNDLAVICEINEAQMCGFGKRAESMVVTCGQWCWQLAVLHEHCNLNPWDPLGF